MPLSSYPQIIMPNPSGLSEIISGGCYTMESNEISSGLWDGIDDLGAVKELTIREELQKDIDKWFGDMV